MNTGEWAALATVGLAFLIQFGAGLFHMGRHHQRLLALEEKTKDLQAVAVLSAAMTEFKLQLQEIRGDVKDLLLGRRRRTPAE